MSSLRTDGYVLVRATVDIQQRAQLLACISEAEPGSGTRRRGGRTYAIRGLLWGTPGLRNLLGDIGVDRLVSEAVGREVFAVDALLFDKNADANWPVPGHQDLVMPVAGEVPEAGFDGWVTRRGIVHVEPPVAVLDELIAARIHFDDAPAENGALAVVPGTHRRGRLRDSDLLAIAHGDYSTCAAAAGDVLLIKPLLVHRSSPSKVPGHRRVLHVVYASREPGKRVRWRGADSAWRYR